MEMYLQKLHVHLNIYGGIIIGMQFVKFFCVNDGNKVHHRNFQVMKCLIYYDIHVHAPNPSTKETKGLITYYKKVKYSQHTKIKQHKVLCTKVWQEKVKLL
jgi:hypothetical protein